MTESHHLEQIWGGREDQSDSEGEQSDSEGEDILISSTVFLWTDQGLSVSEFRQDGHTDALFTPGMVTMTLYFEDSIITAVLTEEGYGLHVWPEDGLVFHQYLWNVNLEPGWESRYGEENWGWGPDYIRQPGGSQSGGEQDGRGTEFVDLQWWGEGESSGQQADWGVGSQESDGAEEGVNQQLEEEGLECLRDEDLYFDCTEVKNNISYK